MAPRGPRELTIVIQDAASRTLRREGKPMHRRDILASLRGEGIEVPGRSPENTLSAYMSKDDRFVTHGYIGVGRTGVWGLREWRDQGGQR